MEEIVTRAADAGARPHGAGYATRDQRGDRARVCPRCGGAMNARFFGHGCHIVVDECDEHGTWFDVHGLSSVIDAVAGGVRWHRLERPPPRAGRPEAAPHSPPDRPSSLSSTLEEIGSLADRLSSAARNGDVERVSALCERLGLFREDLSKMTRDRSR
jgi:hypothetical protein